MLNTYRSWWNRVSTMSCMASLTGVTIILFRVVQMEKKQGGRQLETLTMLVSYNQQNAAKWRVDYTSWNLQMAAAFSPISNQVTQQFGDRVYFLFLFISTTAYRNFTFVLDIDTELITTQSLRTFYRNNLLHKTFSKCTLKRCTYPHCYRYSPTHLLNPKQDNKKLYQLTDTVKVLKYTDSGIVPCSKELHGCSNGRPRCSEPSKLSCACKVNARKTLQSPWTTPRSPRPKWPRVNL